MSNKLLGSICCLVLCASACRADVGPVQTLLQAILAAPDDANPPSPEQVRKQFSVVPTMPTDEIQQVLPLGQKCLHSPSKTARAHGLYFLYMVSFQKDGSQLLERYLSDVSSFMGDSDLAFRREAILILASGHPRPSPRGLEYLAAHLKDEDNSFRETAMIAGPLIEFLPSDVGTIRTILGVVQARADPKLAIGIIQDLGLSHVTTEEALGFIRARLADANPDVRRASVDAVRHMPKEIRDGFANELQRITGNSDELPETRSLAGEVLVQ